MNKRFVVGMAQMCVTEKEKTTEPFFYLLNVVFTMNNLHRHQKLEGEKDHILLILAFST